MNFRQNCFFMLVVIFASCNNNSSKEKVTGNGAADTAESNPVKIMIPDAACYIWVNGRDTIWLKAEFFPNVVTGTLSYRFFEKDGSKGDIDGKLSGDTLIADYAFASEGKTAVRQVAFLLTDSTATEGYGPLEEKEGRAFFRSPAQIDFANGTRLVKTSCIEQ